MDRHAGRRLSLYAGDGHCTVQNSGDALPLRLDQDTAARRLLMFGGLVEALKELLEAYEDGASQCHCDRSGHMAPGPCTPCKARDAIAQAGG
jgi:hypothetical protein